MSFRLAPALLTAALLLPGAAGAQTLYQGTVGTSPIVLQLEKDGEEAFGRYFYRRTRFDSDLSGEREGEDFKLESRLTGDRLVLKRQGRRLAGTLTTSKGRTLPVSLQVATPPPPPAGAPKDLDGYARMQLAGLRFTMGESVRIGTRRIRWYQEPVSGTRLFRLEDGYPTDPLRKINAALSETQWRHVQSWFDCPGFGGGAGIDTDDASTPYLDDRFVSYAWQSAWSCSGAAHPDFGTSGVTYDARTGAMLKLEDLLRFGTAAPPAEESDIWYSYRGKQFAPGLVALLKRYHPDEMADKGADPEDGDCNYADPDVWDFPSWYLTADGLFVGAYFARVERACDAPDWAIIPWKALNGPAARP
ncbi:hypothetical protein [Sphingomonas xinjiangensis]|uniref:DUF3298 domain-containing protein n=1 Tax=Sphingomonas xinjiangensis TaxID=643568 RepID=A0A840YJ60_9SPHN|nr:hypothetical protein [Sphingomonas xinjiangensis]MBB5708826.1 hypothetical protein [Sphingomonas xinjiangensis]